MGAETSTQMDTAGQFFREENRPQSKSAPATSTYPDAAAPADPNHSPLKRAQSIFSESTDDGDSTSTNIDTPGKFLRMTSKSSVDARKARTHRRPKGDDDDVSRHCSKASLGSFALSSDSVETPHQSSRNQCSDSDDSPTSHRRGCTNEGDSDAGTSSRGGSKPSLASHASRSSSTSARLRQKAANGMNHLKASMCAKGGA